MTSRTSTDIPARTAVLLINTGSPDAPEAGAVRRYLAEFLSDRRVIELPRWKWWPILHGIILRVRPSRSAQRYRGVWTAEGSPLIVHTRHTARCLAERLPDVRVAWAMRYGNPSIEKVVEGLVHDGVERLVVMPLFAQYASQTTGACLERVFRVLGGLRTIPAVRTVNDYHLEDVYLDALAARIRAARADDASGRRSFLLMSFHGIPASSVTRHGDRYEAACRETAAALAGRLGLSAQEWATTFQSRFGREEWLRPYTLSWVREHAREHDRLDVVCPGFAADCLETVEEIGDELREAYRAANPEGTFRYIPALNASEEAVGAYAAILRRELGGWS